MSSEADGLDDADLRADVERAERSARRRELTRWVERAPGLLLASAIAGYFWADQQQNSFFQTPGGRLMSAFYAAAIFVSFFAIFARFMARQAGHRARDEYLDEVALKTSSLGRIDTALRSRLDDLTEAEERFGEDSHPSASTASEATGSPVAATWRELLATDAENKLQRYYLTLSAHFERQSVHNDGAAVAAVVVGGVAAVGFGWVALPTDAADAALAELVLVLLVKAGISVPAGVLFVHFARQARRLRHLAQWNAILATQLAAFSAFCAPLPEDKATALRVRLADSVFASPGLLMVDDLKHDDGLMQMFVPRATADQPASPEQPNA